MQFKSLSEEAEPAVATVLLQRMHYDKINMYTKNNIIMVPNDPYYCKSYKNSYNKTYLVCNTLML